ncbi:C6 transcription factor Prf, putative [Talaromyces stipitatus ATCC 10500]|uniref:C6 transcription factor Prf, putative n=1 Tax=Talaromyces stipitatus (strain ATCC 10500 / CBS 375.48 / QM 6759 / NRRL 1006) TaxID=441959 RepID=B8LWG1_TALSN|nr:C6 transcription factor Prf, putative [Talaromyces stipitatus ATCC 10500]EED24272.1 C6 transcription factor Prf, putative [Talaromyces stipitatus ATCC 10500]
MTEPDEDYFNNLSRQSISQDASQSQSGNTGGNTSPTEDDNNPIPRTKRVACIVCRKRKLRCDGQKPSCATCARVGHNCAYDEVRKKSGPKRGYVKQLEARLAQVEILLKNQEPDNSSNETSRNAPPSTSMPPAAPSTMSGVGDLLNFVNNSASQHSDAIRQSQASQNGAPTTNSNLDAESSWEVLSLGLEEPLPTQDVMDELFDIFFQKIHPSHPMIHRPRFFTSMSLAPHMRPPVCLRYIMWALAASITPKYSFLEEHLYARARKYIHLDEMKGHGEHMVSVSHCQAWVLIGLYEFKQMFFPRAWISVGRGARMAAMMCFNRLDGVGLDVKHCVPPPCDWVEREERRRTFWMSFSQDRYASIGTGWPMVFDERDIMTNLPASEEAYLTGTPEKAPSLKDVLAGDITNLSPLGSVAVMACIFGLNLTHLHRPDPQDREDDVNGEFWKRHRAYDNILLNISLSLPQALRLPQGIADPNIVFSNMAIHTSTICLHQAAIFKAEKHKTMNQIAAESKRRCIIAADQIASIMKMVSHTDLSLLNPFSAFCLYVAARVFVQYLKSRPEGQAVKSSLQFLLTALGALKQFSALTESFLIQLDVDLSGTTFGSSMRSMRSKEVQSESDTCAPIVNIRSSEADTLAEGNTNKNANANHSGSPAGMPASSQSFGSLPNRQRSNNTSRNEQQSSFMYHKGGFETSTDTANNHTPHRDDNDMLTNFNMDISPVVSGISDHIISENASPQTTNSSSNNAFTPPNMEQTSIGGPINNLPPKVPLDPSPVDFSAGLDGFSNNGNVSFSPFFDSNTLNTGMDDLAMENHTNGNWESLIQGSGLASNAVGEMMGNTNDFSDRQFDLLLQNMGWNGWPS